MVQDFDFKRAYHSKENGIVLYDVIVLTLFMKWSLKVEQQT